LSQQFVPRNWILDEVIQRVDKKADGDIINNIMTMALNPFAEEWGIDRTEEERFCGDVPKYMGGMQCSCSS
jgi:serine/tyrosine/threonine adenylyltransferase